MQSLSRVSNFLMVDQMVLFIHSSPIQKNDGCNHISCSKVFQLNVLEYINIIAHACISVTMTSAGCVWTSGRFTTTKQVDTLCE